MLKNIDDKTIPFRSIPAKVLTEARQKIAEIHGGKEVHDDTIVTVLKSMIYPGSAIISVPRKVDSRYGTTFRISLRNSTYPAFASKQQILGL